MKHFKDADEYLATASLYQLGPLATEAPHLKTAELSDWAKFDVKKGLRVFKEIDLTALNLFFRNTDKIDQLSRNLHKTLEAGGRIFICGCGATGRLALNLERLWRAEAKAEEQDQVVSFMAGGDMALVHSLEGFEDFSEHGARHLMQMGFGKKDLLLAVTEGGETPFVLGALNQALEVSEQKPYFLYCNSDKILRQHVERSKKMLEHPGVRKINLSVGPMALAGSTRLQASSVQMMAIGLALFFKKALTRDEQFKKFYQFYQNFNVDDLERFVVEESKIYKNNQQVIYQVDPCISIVAFTDTTERSPTFSLPGFEKRTETPQQSLCYISINGTKTSEAAWKALLLRTPQQVNWLEVDSRTTDQALLEYDFSESVSSWRNQKPFVRFYINGDEEGCQFKLGQQALQVDWSGQHMLFNNLFLKMLLNMHSTMVMGRMNRFEGNVMTWVRASNGKLIDRAARCVMWLFQKDTNYEVSYESVVREIFKCAPDLAADEPLVMTVYQKLCAQMKEREPAEGPLEQKPRGLIT